MGIFYFISRSFSGLENTYNDWIWFDYSGLPLGVPIAFTIIIGNTAFIIDGCGMYTLEINFEIPIAGVFSDQNVCSGQLIPSIPVLSGTTWTNDNPSIGLSAAGSGNIPSFTAINNKVAPVVANIVVTTINFCVNRTTNYRIMINPIS